MSRRRRSFLALGLLACVLLTSGVAWLLWPRSAITRENAAKIQVGMTLADVEAILGGPARDESTGDLEPDATGVKDMIMWAFMRNGEWRSNSVVVYVTLDSEGRILECYCDPVRRVQEGPIEMLRHWLRL